MKPILGDRPARAMKRRRIPVSLYLPPEIYWALRDRAAVKSTTIQALLRPAIDDIIKERT